MENILENNRGYFIGSYKELENVSLFGNRMPTVKECFRKAIRLEDLRAAYKLGRIMLLAKNGDRQEGLALLEQTADKGYTMAESFLEFYRSLSEPVTEELLKGVTLESENSGLLLLAGQMHMRSTYPVFNQPEYAATQCGLALIEKSAQMGNLEAVHFLYECYMGYFWQIEPDKEKAQAFLKKYLSKTNDKIEAEILKDFDTFFDKVTSNRRDFRFETLSKSLSKDLPYNRGSLDDSYYDKYREQ